MTDPTPLQRLRAKMDAYLDMHPGQEVALLQAAWAAVSRSAAFVAEPVSFESSDRECSRCGEEVATLNSNDECAACEALPKCDECGTREGDGDYLGHPIELNRWSKLNPPVQMCPSCTHNAYRSGWEPGQE